VGAQSGNLAQGTRNHTDPPLVTQLLLRVGFEPTTLIASPINALPFAPSHSVHTKIREDPGQRGRTAVVTYILHVFEVIVSAMHLKLQECMWAWPVICPAGGRMLSTVSRGWGGGVIDRSVT